MFLSKLLANQPQSFRYKFRNYQPCGTCGKHCDSDESLILDCGVCQKHFHRSCIRLSKQSYKDLKQNDTTFICSCKCSLSLLPFSECDNIDFFSALFGDSKYLCGKCSRDCLEQTACIQCSICEKWDHFECSGLSVKEFKCNDYYFCCKSCEVSVLPFTEVSTNTLVKNGIFHELANSKSVPKQKKTKKNKSTNKPQVKRLNLDHFLDINCG